jgi:hypothetical protein
MRHARQQEAEGCQKLLTSGQGLTGGRRQEGIEVGRLWMEQAGQEPAPTSGAPPGGNGRRGAGEGRACGDGRRPWPAPARGRAAPVCGRPPGRGSAPTAGRSLGEICRQGR